LLLSLGTIPAMLAVPVLTTPRRTPIPSREIVRTLDLLAAQRAAATSKFSLIGATWDASAVPADAQLEVRVRQAGHWSAGHHSTG